MKKYILRSMPDVKNKTYFQYVVLSNDFYNFTHDFEKATRFNTIGDAMRKSAEIYTKHKCKFQAYPIEED